MIGITKGQIDHPDRILSYFKRELPILGIVTVTGLLYNLGLGAGPYFEGLMAQCLYDILRHDAVPMDMVKIAAAYVVVLGLVQAMRAGKRYSVRIFSAQISWIMRHTLYPGAHEPPRAGPGKSGQPHDQGRIRRRCLL